MGRDNNACTKVIILTILMKYVLSQRRITNGSISFSDTDSSFVVYLIGGEDDFDHGDWLCGGSIIHPYLILTSAACVMDVANIYAVAGYNTYVPPNEMHKDPCTSRLAHRIISYCVRTSYELELSINWARADIAIAKTDRPFDFYDQRYLQYCSYLPTAIHLQYNLKFEDPDTSVIAFGWGHSKYFSPEGDLRDFNEKNLQYTRTVIMDKTECMSYFDIPYIMRNIRQLCICTSGEDGTLKSDGTILVDDEPMKDQCGHSEKLKKQGFYLRTNSDEDDLSKKKRKKKPVSGRRHGICQNDHGSPLVTWIGGKPHVLGVACTAAVMPNMECVAPYIFNSVSCSSQFIHCVFAAQYTKYKKKGARRYLDATCGNENRTLFTEFKIPWTVDNILLKSQAGRSRKSTTHKTMPTKPTTKRTTRRRTTKTTTTKATTEKPSTVKATTEETTTVEATPEESTILEATTEETTTVEAKTEESTTVDAITEESTTVKATTEETSTVEATPEESTILEATTEETTTVEAKTEESTSVEAITEESTTVKATTESLRTTSNESSDFSFDDLLKMSSS